MGLPCRREPCCVEEGGETFPWQRTLPSFSTRGTLTKIGDEGPLIMTPLHRPPRSRQSRSPSPSLRRRLRRCFQPPPGPSGFPPPAWRPPGRRPRPLRPLWQPPLQLMRRLLPRGYRRGFGPDCHVISCQWRLIGRTEETWTGLGKHLNNCRGGRRWGRGGRRKRRQGR